MTNNTYGTLYGVGIGPGDPGLITMRAVEVLQKVDSIFHVAGPRSQKSVSGSVVDTIPNCTASRHKLIFSMEKTISDRETAWMESAEKVINELKKGNNVAFVTLGDPLIYSTFGYLRRKILQQVPDLKIQVIPGITSFQAAASVQGEPLVEDKEILKIIPTADNGIPADEMMSGANTAVMLKTYKHRNDTLKALQNHSKLDSILYAARVGLNNQVIESDPSSVAELPLEYLSMLIAKRKKRD